MRIGIVDTNNPGWVEPYCTWFNDYREAVTYWNDKLEKEGYWDSTGRGGCTEDHFDYNDVEQVTKSILKVDLSNDVKIRMLREVWLGVVFQK